MVGWPHGGSHCTLHCIIKTRTSHLLKKLCKQHEVRWMQTLPILTRRMKKSERYRRKRQNSKRQNEQPPKEKGKDKKGSRTSEPSAPGNAPPGTSKGNGRGKKGSQNSGSQIQALKSCVKGWQSQAAVYVLCFWLFPPKGIKYPYLNWIQLTRINLYKGAKHKALAERIQLVQMLFMQVRPQSCQVLSQQVGRQGLSQ